MQTFLPYPNIRDSLECLDTKRLGKQRVEAMQLVKAIETGGAWSNHPAAKMWKDNLSFLKLYHDMAIIIWKERGYKNTMKPFYSLTLDELPRFFHEPIIPSWWGNKDFHASHRSNLLRKDPIHYGQFGWVEPNDLPYVWPVQKGKAA